MVPGAGSLMSLGGGIVVRLDVAQQVEDGGGIAAPPGEDRGEEKAHLGQGQRR